MKYKIKVTAVKWIELDVEVGNRQPFDNFEELEKSTIELLRNPGKVKEFGENALEASNNWSDEFILEKWRDILN